MKGEVMVDLIWRIVTLSALFAVLVKPVLFSYRRIRYRLAHGVWPKKTPNEITVEEQNKEYLEKALERERVEGDPYFPGSVTWSARKVREDTFRDTFNDPFER